jgi:uncharacterized membrane protein
MVGTSQGLILAVAVFVGGHFFLSSLVVRESLIKTLGLNGFRLSYSVAALASLAWTVLAYRAAPVVPLWDPGLRPIPLLIMPIVTILLVAGNSTPNVTAVAGERHADGPRPVGGIVTVTRHPVLWGIGLWAVAHLLANGDEASVTLFGGMAVLAFGGMAHIDHRRRAAMGGAWGPIALTTSVIPFAAALQGRTKIDWAGIGPWRLLGGLALYGVLILLHGWAGVPVWPG